MFTRTSPSRGNAPLKNLPPGKALPFPERDSQNPVDRRANYATA